MMVVNTIKGLIIMKKFILGIIVGMAIMVTGSVFADGSLKKIEAYLRPSLPITLNGENVTLENPPVMYDGSTYLRLRDIADITGLGVNWNEKSQTVELIKGVETVEQETQIDVNAVNRKIDNLKNIIDAENGYLESLTKGNVSGSNDTKIKERQEIIQGMKDQLRDLENSLQK